MTELLTLLNKLTDTKLTKSDKYLLIEQSRCSNLTKEHFTNLIDDYNFSEIASHPTHIKLNVNSIDYSMVMLISVKNLTNQIHVRPRKTVTYAEDSKQYVYQDQIFQHLECFHTGEYHIVTMSHVPDENLVDLQMFHSLPKGIIVNYPTDIVDITSSEYVPKVWVLTTSSIELLRKILTARSMSTVEIHDHIRGLDIGVDYLFGGTLRVETYNLTISSEELKRYVNDNDQ